MTDSDKRAQLQRDAMHAANQSGTLTGFLLVATYEENEEERWESWEESPNRWSMMGATLAAVIGSEIMRLRDEGDEQG